MQLLALSVVLFVSAVLGHSPRKHQYETTASNELDNSVFPTESSTNFPNSQTEDQTSNNNVPSTPFPQPVPRHYTPYRPHRPIYRPVVPAYSPYYPNYMPGPYPQYTPFNRPVVPGYNPNYIPGSYPVMPFVRPMPFMPYQRFPFAPQQMNGRNMVIVKLLQPIILPIAKPFGRRGNRNNNNDIDNGRYLNGGFQRRNTYNRFNRNGFNNEIEFNNMAQRRFAMNQYNANRRFGVANEMQTGRYISGQYQTFGNRRFGSGYINRPMPYRQNTFGPYKVGGGDENIHVTVNLH